MGDHDDARRGNALSRQSQAFAYDRAGRAATAHRYNGAARVHRDAGAPEGEAHDHQ